MVLLYERERQNHVANVGKTMSFRDHADAHAHFSMPWHPGLADGGASCRALFRKLEPFYDTVQFTHRCENVYKHEIVFIKHTSSPSNACTSVPLYHKGVPCKCDTSSVLLRCCNSWTGSASLVELAPTAPTVSRRGPSIRRTSGAWSTCRGNQPFDIS